MSCPHHSIVPVEVPSTAIRGNGSAFPEALRPAIALAIVGIPFQRNGQYGGGCVPMYYSLLYLYMPLGSPTGIFNNDTLKGEGEG